MTSHRTLILGTAGHVDHGKTALVRALTGKDTDRLEEEHRRGISIELGFAELRLADDLTLGIVDVPGHERFVRQMVAGAGGMDMAMLLVAADEGVMPQTREHLDVLRLLGVRHGLLVLTKIDLADPELVEVIEAELSEMVEGTFLESAPILRVSSVSGEGLDDLKRALRSIAGEVPDRARAGDFRLPIDRIFVLQGAGVVVTGTAWSGTVESGSELRLLPQDRTLRVREVQTHDRAVERAGAGERVALSLHGVKKDEVSRGDQLVSGPAWTASKLLGIRVEAVGDETLAGRVRQRARLHVHHAAREVLGRIDLLDEEVSRLSAGQSAYARLILEEPLIARPGDRIVLRTYSPMLTAAGAVVIDPAVRPGARRARVRSELQRLELGGEVAWALASAGTGGTTIADARASLAMLGQAAETADAALDAAVGDGRLVRLGDLLFDGHRLDEQAERAMALLRAHQEQKPLTAGLPKEELRQALGFTGAAHAFNRLLQAWSERHPVFVRSDRVRVDQPEPELDTSQMAELSELEERIRAARPLYEASDSELRDPRLQRLIDLDRAARLEGRLVAHRSHLDELVEQVANHLAEHDSLEIGQVKEWTGASRKFVVPLLEWLDAAQITRFDGKQRRRGPRCP